LAECWDDQRLQIVVLPRNILCDGTGTMFVRHLRSFLFIHASFCGPSRNSFKRLTDEWSDRNIDDPDPELDGLKCKLLRCLFRNGTEPATGGGGNAECELFASQSE
jgi:hypothetical protein